MVLVSTIEVSETRRNALLSFLLVGCLLFPNSAKAGDPIVVPPLGGMTLSPMITQSGTYNTNPLLLSTGQQTLIGSVTVPELVFDDVTPTSELKSDTSVVENVFNHSTFDSTDLHSSDTITTKNERWSLGATGKIDYDTTRTSEVSTFNIRSVPVRHLGLDAAPQVSYNFLPTDKLGLNGDIQTSHYATSAFTNYETYSLTPSYTHDIDPLNSAVFQLQTQRYQATRGPTNINETVGPTVGWLGKLTPRLSITANVGVEFIKQIQDNAPQTSWTPEYVFNADVAFKGEQDKVDLVASRSEYPFGNGTEALLSTFSLADKHALNEKFSLNTSGSYESGTYQTSATGNLKAITTLDGGLAYHVTEHLDVAGTYQYRYETLVNVTKSIDDHSVNFGLVYHPQAWGL